MGKFMGAVVKSVIIGLVASYAIKYIQDKFLGDSEDVADDEKDVAKAE